MPDKHTFEPPKQGDKIRLETTDYYAYETKAGCDSCDLAAFEQKCKATNCFKVVWLTLNNYIIHRLKS